MKEDGYRYTVSYKPSLDYLLVSENMHGGQLHYKNGQFSTYSVSSGSLTEHFKYYMEAFTNPKREVCRLSYRSIKQEGILITETDHGCFTVTYNRQIAEVTPAGITHSFGFDKTKAMQLIGKMWSITLTKPNILFPKTDVLRYLSEYNLLIFYDGQNTVVVDKDNCTDLTLHHCLINGHPYSNVMITVDKVKNLVALHDFNFYQLCTFTLDDSVLKLFKDSETLLREKEILHEYKYST